MDKTLRYKDLHDAYMSLPQEPNPAESFELHVNAKFLDKLRARIPDSDRLPELNFTGIPVVLDPWIEDDPGYAFIPRIRQTLHVRM